MMRMLWVRRSQQDIRIGKDHRLQTAFGVNGLPADVLVGEQRKIVRRMTLRLCLELPHPFFRWKLASGSRCRSYAAFLFDDMKEKIFDRDAAGMRQGNQTRLSVGVQIQAHTVAFLNNIPP